MVLAVKRVLDTLALLTVGVIASPADVDLEHSAGIAKPTLIHAGIVEASTAPRTQAGTLPNGSDEMVHRPRQKGSTAPIPAVHVAGLPSSTYRAVRSVLDRFMACALLIVCAPVIVVIASSIRLSSPGPAVFRQQRVGQDGKPFTMFKFRTMRVEAPVYSLKIADDHPIITRVGSFLRRSGLDELPQLWNVVRGEMAMIGPRPEQIHLYSLYEPWQRQRQVVRPGITGWWQIHHRDGVPLHLNVDKDLYYIKHQGLWIDWLIVVGTCKIVLAAFSAAFPMRSSPQGSSALVENVSREGKSG